MDLTSSVCLSSPAIFFGYARNGTVSSDDLRHACAANLIKQGNSAKAIQLHLGHGSIRITMDTYGRLFEGDDAALATGMEAALQAARGGAS